MLSRKFIPLFQGVGGVIGALWILAAGAWNDVGVWKDDDVWKDS